MRLRLLQPLAPYLSALAFQFAPKRNAVDLQVRKEIEELNLTYDEAFNQNDAEAVATLFTADAVESGPEEAVSGQQEIEDKYKILFESHPNGHATQLDQLYAIGSRA
jgi:ketosteroid isomerase-like protein